MMHEEYSFIDNKGKKRDLAESICEYFNSKMQEIGGKKYFPLEVEIYPCSISKDINATYDLNFDLKSKNWNAGNIYTLLIDENAKISYVFNNKLGEIAGKNLIFADIEDIINNPGKEKYQKSSENLGNDISLNFKNNMFRSTVDRNQYYGIIAKLERNIIEDFQFAYSDVADKYKKHAIKRFGSKRKGTMKRVAEEGIPMIIEDDITVYNPDENDYVMFFDENLKLQHAMNTLFMEQIIDEEAKKKFSLNLPKGSKVMGINMVLTGEANKIPWIFSIKPYISFTERLALSSHNTAKEILEVLQAKRIDHEKMRQTIDI